MNPEGDTLGRMVREKVWYLSAPTQNRWSPRAWAAKRIGVLEVRPGKVEFRGKRGHVVLEQPWIVSVGLAGADTINVWITIADRDGNQALFADGSRLGWGGVRGGTVKLAAELEQALGAKAT